jgi:CheY-like chemotaxis protein
MSELQTVSTEFTQSSPAAAKRAPLLLLADADGASRDHHAALLTRRGFRVAIARTGFEAIVKASCTLPDVILLDDSLGDSHVRETFELLSTCPATAHIRIVSLKRGRALPRRLLAISR